MEEREFRRGLFLGGMGGVVEAATTETVQSPFGYGSVAPYARSCHFQFSEVAAVNVLRSALERYGRPKP